MNCSHSFLSDGKNHVAIDWKARTSAAGLKWFECKYYWSTPGQEGSPYETLVRMLIRALKVCPAGVSFDDFDYCNV